MLARAVSALCLLTFPAQAMDYTVTNMPDSDRIVIVAQGRIERGEEERFAIYLREALERAGEGGEPPVVAFHSGGGAVPGAFALGRAIRAAGLDTLVPRGGKCASSCTTAFLGGVHRSVEGPFLIHSTSIDMLLAFTDELVESFVRKLLAGVKEDIDYAKEMTGSDALVFASFEVPTAELVEVSDSDLRDWQVITLAVRPEQELVPPDGVLATCPERDAPMGIKPEVYETLCTDLRLARAYRRIEILTAALDGNPGAAADLAQAPAFEAAWRGCAEIVETARDGPDCMLALMEVRRAQLAGLADYLAAVNALIATEFWAPPR